MKYFRQAIGLSVGIFLALGAGLAFPATAQEMSEEELEALGYNLVALCDASFEDLAEMGIEFNRPPA